MSWRAWVYTVPLRLRSVFRREQVDRELDEELQFHLEQQTEQEIASGRYPDEARRIALRRMSGLTQLREECREMRHIGHLEHLMQDLSYGWRICRRTPGFSATAIATLALGIGVNIAIFSAVDSTLLRALPYAEPDRLTMIYENGQGSARNWPTPGNFAEWRRRNHAFADMAAIRTVSAILTSDGPAEQLFGRRVTANFFSIMGVHPQLGRTFTEEEEGRRTPVAVISYALWQQHYGGDPKICGRKIVMDDTPVEVIGVLPREFSLQRRNVSFWMPVSFSAADLENRTTHSLYVVARLRPGATPEFARRDMRAVASEMSAQYAEDRRVGAEVVAIKDELLGNARTGLLLVLGAAGIVLLIACANLASLLTARTVSRQVEISVRLALGAGRARLVRQLVTEAMLLALGGGVLGMAIAPAGIGVLARLVPETLPSTATPHVDLRLAIFAVLISLVTGLLFSVAPALRVIGRSPAPGLKEDSRTGIGARGRGMLDVLVVAEVSLALVLLVGAGLMIRTLANMGGLELGFRPDRLLTLRTVFSPKYRNAPARLAFTNRILQEVRAIPGVSGAGYVSTLPFESRGDTTGYRIEGRALPPEDPADALHRVVSGDYLQTLGAQWSAGRHFASSDTPDSAPVVIVNETFARKYWPAGNAAGHRVAIRLDRETVWRTIVGVIRDVRESGYDVPTRPAIYQPDTQAARPLRDLIVRTHSDPMQIAPAVRNAIASIDREQPLTWVRGMDEVLDLGLADRRQVTMLLSAFALLSLMAALLGLYGSLSYAVTQRRQELGLRIALGATPARVQATVVARGLVLTVVGLSIGLAVSLALTHLMNDLLYGVGALDPATFVGMCAMLAVVASLACWVPAVRASRLDPTRVLKGA
jgi:predicted permease